MDGHIKAFHCLGGIPAEVLYDKSADTMTIPSAKAFRRVPKVMRKNAYGR